MVNLSKAIVANTDLASSLAFNYKLDNFDFALLVSGTGENVFLKIKQTMLELEPSIHEEQGPAPVLFEKITPILSKKLINVDNLQILYIAWNNNVLYLRSTTSDTENQNQQAYLLRDNSLSPLIQPTQINQLISGHIKEGDKLLLISSLGNQISFESLKSLSDSTPETFQDSLLAVFSTLDQGSPTSAILLSVESALAEPIPTPDENYLNPLPHSNTRKFKLPISFPKPKLRLKLTRKKIIIFVVILLALSLGAFFLFSSNRPNPTSNTADITSNITQRIALAEAESDPTALQKHISDIDALINQARSKKVDPKTLEEFSNSLTILKDKAQNIHHLSDLPIFIELQLIKDKFSPKRLSYSVSRFLLLDPSIPSLVTLQEGQKNFTVQGGVKQLGNAQLASINSDFAFSYSPDKGIQRVDVTNSEVAAVAKPDSSLGQVTDLVAFANNVYLLSSDKDSIWKYSPIAKGYSEKIAYLKEGVVTDLSLAKQMQIDGSVWILKSSDEIIKYTQGSQDFFALTGLPEPATSISSFYVSSDTENLYLLDKVSSKLIVVDKQGKYVASYLNDKLANIIDFVVNEEEKLVYLLDSQNIYTLNLK